MRHPTTFFLLLGLAAGSAHATTYYVAATGNDLFTGTQASPLQHIQAGINRAADGDTVYVVNGTYTGELNTNLAVQDKNITLRSAGGAANCTIDCAGAPRGIQFVGNASDSTLDGFTIRNANYTAATGDSGGGIAIIGCSPTILNCVVTGNSVQGTSGDAFGGGIAIQNGSPFVMNCTIAYNNAQAFNGIAAGAGVLVKDGGTPWFAGCSIIGNGVACYGTGATAVGGGFYSEDCAPALTDCIISNNTTFGDGNVCAGAGMYTTGAALARCTISSNLITGEPMDALGAGVNAAPGTPGTLSMLGCTVSGNRLNDATLVCRGAGLFLAVPSTLTRCTVQGNIAHIDSDDFDEGAYGCGIYAEASLTAAACRFVENDGSGVKSGHGGGIACLGTSLRVENCSFLGNNLTQLGNAAGGAIYLDNTPATVVNSVFASNVAQETANGLAFAGAVGAFGSGECTLTNDTFADNSSNGVNRNAYSGAIHVGTGCSGTITNCILFGDTCPNDAEVGVNGTCTISYSRFQGGVSSNATDGGHDISADPQFVRAPGTNGSTDYGDLHLQAGSPCVNAGTASAPSLPAYDLGGYARNQGGAPDIGAYETGSAPVFDIYVDKAAGSDTTGTGTSTKPYQTVAKALSADPDPLGLAVIHTKQGNYSSDKPRVTGFVHFVNWTDTGRASIGKQ